MGAGTVVLQALINGILMGGIYALVAAGLTMIYGVIKIMNFAHGEFMMLGMYISFFAFTMLGMDPYISILLTLVILFVLGCLIQKNIIERILNDPPLNQLLLTIGLSLFISNLVTYLWSPDNRILQASYSSSTITLADLVFHIPRLVAFFVAIVVCFGMYLFLKNTRMGKGIRASAENRTGALLVGIDVKKSYTISFGLGVAMAGVAGTLLSPFFYINPTSGQAFSFTAYVVVVLGTMGNFLGALIGGLIIGIAESLGTLVLAPSLKQVVSFGIFILVLLFKPSGLFGGKR